MDRCVNITMACVVWVHNLLGVNWVAYRKRGSRTTFGKGSKKLTEVRERSLSIMPADDLPAEVPCIYGVTAATLRTSGKCHRSSSMAVCVSWMYLSRLRVITKLSICQRSCALSPRVAICHLLRVILACHWPRWGGNCSTVQKTGYFEVRKSSQVTRSQGRSQDVTLGATEAEHRGGIGVARIFSRMHLFSFLFVALKTQAANAAGCFTVNIKQIKRPDMVAV